MLQLGKQAQTRGTQPSIASRAAVGMGEAGHRPSHPGESQSRGGSLSRSWREGGGTSQGTPSPSQLQAGEAHICHLRKRGGEREGRFLLQRNWKSQELVSAMSSLCCRGKVT